MMQESSYPGRYWHVIQDGRIQCDLCPRDCRLHEGQRGACFVRARRDNRMVLTSYGRSSGFCIDPIEKKPLNHFYPGSSVLSFGTAGCNLTCKFCQNWDINKSRDMDRLMDQAPPIVRDGYQIKQYRLSPDGHCPHCGAAPVGRFGAQSGNFGHRRIPIAIKTTQEPEHEHQACPHPGR